jgi:alpha-L-rhamnosidase
MNILHRWKTGTVVVLTGLLTAGRLLAALTPLELRCEYAGNPLGVDTPQPRLFWKLDSLERGQSQTAYQVLVASSPAILAKNQGDLWDSRRVRSPETTQILYHGKPLKSSQSVFWKVRVWNQTGAASAWSPAAAWTMGLLQPADWQARWIGAPSTNHAPLLLRRAFNVKPGLQRAIVHVCGLGQYELSLNGGKIGAELLSPGWTKYDRTCLYDTYDITAGLRQGPNVAGLFLGNGMYHVAGGRYTKFKGSFGPLQAIALCRLEYADGSTETFGTDEQWRVHAGPITFSCVYGGEDYDARNEPRGWTQPDFDDSAWDQARMTNGPGGVLRGQSCAAPPVRAIETLNPARISALNPRVAVYDLGQNAPVIPRLAVHGPSGSSVKIIPAELLRPDGSVDRGSAGGAEAYWKYTLAGSGAESWFPKFFYHGCRYLQVERAPATADGELPVVETLAGVVVHSIAAPVGDFTSSNELFNRIRTLVRWAQRANMVSVLTDCPHRERLGWLEQYHLNGPALRYEFDLAQLFTKGLHDMADSQLANGLVPDIAPEYTVFKDGFRDSVEWGSAYLIVPWQQYEWTGDRQLLARHYDGMKRYVDYLARQATNHVISYGLGDWYDIGPKRPGVAQLTPVALTATAFYYYDTWILAQTAKLLGNKPVAKQYSQRAAHIAEAFNQRFLNPATHQYATGSQCANSIALVMHLIPKPEDRTPALEAIVADVRTRGNALTAGDVGYRYLLRALAEGGRSDVLFDVNNQSEKPGYGYQLKMGATSLTEAWDADRRSSQNHFMLGQIMEWFYHDLAGIAGDPTAPGFKKIIICPQPVGDLTWVKASYDSIRGKIVSEWNRSKEQFELTVRIPPNTSATVFLPAPANARILESGHPAQHRPGVTLLRRQEPCAVFRITSGTYQFHALWGQSRNSGI